MTTQTIPTRVGPLTVDVQGPANKPTALLWHSLFVDPTTWRRVLPDLALDRRLVVITGPGQGTSGDPGRRYTMADCADAAREALDATGATGPVDWVGNAWGGHVGILFAVRHPDRLNTLVTTGTPVHGYTILSRLQTLLLTALYGEAFVRSPTRALGLQPVRCGLANGTLLRPDPRRAHDEGHVGRGRGPVADLLARRCTGYARIVARPQRTRPGTDKP